MAGMAMLQAVVVLGLLALALYAAVRMAGRAEVGGGDGGPPALTHGHWRTGHYDTESATRVVLQKVSEEGARVLDEHVIATISASDPEYDEKYLAAMSIARQRQALFESEDGG
jgi:hypothetical protein